MAHRRVEGSSTTNAMRPDNRVVGPHREIRFGMVALFVKSCEDVIAFGTHGAVEGVPFISSCPRGVEPPHDRALAIFNFQRRLSELG